MSIPTGASTLGNNTGQGFKPSIQQGKSKGGFTPFSQQQFTPEQMQLFQSMFGQVAPGSFLSRLAGGDQSMFEEMEAPAMRQFQGLQGQLASRFSGMGSGARRSSGFQNTMNQATSDFAQQLQANRLGLQRQAIGDLSNLSNQLLSQRPFDQFISEKKQPFWKRLLSGGALGQAVPGLFSQAHSMMSQNRQESPDQVFRGMGGSGSSGGSGDMMAMAMKILPFMV